MNSPITETSNLTKTGAAEIQLVVFALAGCEVAVGIQQVREIIRIGEITFMPKAPPFLEGIINLRGKVIPVLDMRKRFQMPLLDRTDESRILVVEIKEQMLGFLVDKVVGVLRVAPSLVEPAQEAVLTVGPEFMEGLVRLDRRLIILLNLKKLLTFDDAKALPGWDANPSAEGSPRGH